MLASVSGSKCCHACAGWRVEHASCRHNCPAISQRGEWVRSPKTPAAEQTPSRLGWLPEPGQGKGADADSDSPRARVLFSQPRQPGSGGSGHAAIAEGASVAAPDNLLSHSPANRAGTASATGQGSLSAAGSAAGDAPVAVTSARSTDGAAHDDTSTRTKDTVAAMTAPAAERRSSPAHDVSEATGDPAPNSATQPIKKPSAARGQVGQGGGSNGQKGSGITASKQQRTGGVKAGTQAASLGKLNKPHGQKAPKAPKSSAGETKATVAAPRQEDAQPVSADTETPRTAEQEVSTQQEAPSASGQQEPSAQPDVQPATATQDGPAQAEAQPAPVEQAAPSQEAPAQPETQAAAAEQAAQGEDQPVMTGAGAQSQPEEPAAPPSSTWSSYRALPNVHEAYDRECVSHSPAHAGGQYWIRDGKMLHISAGASQPKHCRHVYSGPSDLCLWCYSAAQGMNH